jgi:hypothetical protein
MSALVDHRKDENFLIVRAVVDLERELFDANLADIFLNGRSRKRVKGNMLELASRTGEEILAKARSFVFVVSLCASEVGSHRRIENDPPHRSENNSSREIGVVFPDL